MKKKKQEEFDLIALWRLVGHFNELFEDIIDLRGIVNCDAKSLLEEKGKEVRRELLGKLNEGIEQLRSDLCNFINGFIEEEEQQ